MGKTNSKVRNINNQTYINKSQVDILNKSITNQIANSQISQAAKCGANTVQTQNFSLKDLKSAPGYPISITNVRQNQDSTIDFSCTQNQSIRSDISNQLYTAMMNNLKENNSADIMAELEARAATNIKNGFASWGGSNGNSDSSNEIDWTVSNDIYQELQNVIENSIENNFVANNLAECNNSVLQDQNFLIRGLNSGGGIFIQGISQDQASNIYSRCLQDQSVSQEMTNVMANATSTTVENNNSNTSNSKQYGSATGETINNGPFESLGEAWKSIFSGFGSIFGSAKSCSIVCAILIAVIVFCLICSVLAYFLMSSKGLAPKPAELTEAIGKGAKLAALGGGFISELSPGKMPNILDMTANSMSFSEFGSRY